MSYRFILNFFLLLFLLPMAGLAQKDTALSKLQGGDTLKVVPDGTEGVQLAVRSEIPAVKKLPWNEFEGSSSSFRIGMGYIQDFSTNIQDETFKKQMDSAGVDLKSGTKVRDFRLLGSGVLKTKRFLAWKFAYMYDGDKEVWMMRETGLTIG